MKNRWNICLLPEFKGATCQHAACDTRHCADGHDNFSWSFTGCQDGCCCCDFTDPGNYADLPDGDDIREEN